MSSLGFIALFSILFFQFCSHLPHARHHIYNPRTLIIWNEKKNQIVQLESFDTSKKTRLILKNLTSQFFIIIENLTVLKNNLIISKGSIVVGWFIQIFSPGAKLRLHYIECSWCHFGHCKTIQPLFTHRTLIIEWWISQLLKA
jgi:hypothetical protein